ncbi:Rha family transcriptional regulator [Xanthobacter aminoxidans]|uniref:Rha family transcriptional regulator n=1 Tax=Xanthobacter aminoxidans TaxID=186280 RepID=UPI0020230347|nr:Rha family transcriptional regulator [Xanthobacter aminoxidans]MCL8384137.1 Rha family transcriptional regulator [Xanthobacter aminoxidans]
MNAHSAYASSNGIVTLRPIVTRGAAGRPVTNSRDVARYFGKRHDDVLKAIKSLLDQAPSIARNFAANEVEVKVGFGTRKSPTYDMDRDGFTLLAMGFTGPKALQFKMAYIAEFNAMEAELNAAVEKSPFQLPDFTDPAAAARAWADQVEARALSDKRAAKAEKFIADEFGYVTVGEFVRQNGAANFRRHGLTNQKLGQQAKTLALLRGIEVREEMQEYTDEFGDTYVNTLRVHRRDLLIEVCGRYGIDAR